MHANETDTPWMLSVQRNPFVDLASWIFDSVVFFTCDGYFIITVLYGKILFTKHDL